MKFRITHMLPMLVLSAILSSGTTAFAHSFPVEQDPSAGQNLATSPGAVTIKYDAQIEQLFAKLEVLDAEGKNVASEPVVSAGGYVLSAKLPALKPGLYRVKWGVVCVDTHHTQGSYSFTIGG